LTNKTVAPLSASVSKAIAGAVRDLQAQRWLLTRRTYDHENTKQVYYLSIEFLLGWSLTNI